jgi:hypothetical protein
VQLLCQAMPLQAISQFQTHWTNVNSTFSDNEPALLTILTVVDTSTYSEIGPLEFMKRDAETLQVILL